jgi:predicted phage terminase large subunit-like protein|tara:strand:- start:3161 stop:4606 length:1446 start_codon:yes stop_codon:yes gene_type:complete
MNNLNTATTKEMAEALRRKLCEMSYFEFFKEAFKVVEPAVQLDINWHHQYVCQLLQKEAERIIDDKPKTEDLIINVPFRASKSLMCTILFPVWCWIRDPKLRFITASYSASLSVEHSAKSRDVIQSKWFQDNWGDLFSIKPDQNTKQHYVNDHTGNRRATSVGGTVTGAGASIIIVDDPISPKQAASQAERTHANDWYNTTLYSRLDNPRTGVRIIIMQRLHEDDLSGYLLRNNPDGYKHICIPAESSKILSPKGLLKFYKNDLFWDTRFSRKILQDYKYQLGSYEYAGQLQQQPAPADGGLIKKEWFNIHKSFSDEIFMNWNFVVDPAYTSKENNDPSALLAYALYENEYYIRCVEEKYLEFPELVKYIQTFCQRNGYSRASKIYVEPKASGKSIVQTLRRNTRLTVIESKSPSKDKVARISDVVNIIEGGRVNLLDGMWVDNFISQCSQFPNARHDDMVDCLQIALDLYSKGKRITAFR